MSDTTDPKRLLSELAADGNSFERDLLSAGSALTPPSDLDARVWGTLAAQIGAAGAVAAVAGTTATTGAGGATALGAVTQGAKVTVGLAAGGAATKASLGVAAATKVGLLMLAVGVVSGGTYVAIQKVSSSRETSHPAAVVPSSAREPAGPTTAGAASFAATSSAQEAEALAPPLPPPAPRGDAPESPITKPHVGPDTPHSAASSAQAVPSSAPAPSAPTTPAVAPTVEPTEVQYLQTARSCLARGDARCAREAMSKASAKGGSPGLSEERDALTIRLAFAEGRQAEGKALARAFVAAHPKSPLAASIAKLAE